MKKDQESNKEPPSLLEQISQTVLYEGYSLYPYHRAAIKNRKPVPFGTVYPRAYQICHTDVHSTTQTECIIQGSEEAAVAITVRFLHLRKKRLLKIDHSAFGQGQFHPVYNIKANGEMYRSGWQAEEQSIALGTHKMAAIMAHPLKTEIAFEGEQSSDIIFDDDEKVAGNVIIKQSAINGNVVVAAKPAGTEKEGFKITVKITNTTPVAKPEGCDRDDVYDRSFLSANTILQAEGGVFISQTNPGASWSKVSETLKNSNTWPVLIDRDDKTMLSSPIVLYDYPEIAAESQGDMFDATEIEEMLMLHMAALTDEEQQKIDQEDGKMKAMLERVKHTTPEELMNLHGRFEEIKPDGNKQKESEL